jgi:dihydroflavonol-4-reductase
MTATLVTGAAGHIGCNVVRALLEANEEVVAMVRPSSDSLGLDGLEVEVREGDVLDADSLRRALDGVETVVHCAAAHRNFAADPADIVRPAVEGTKNLLDACAARGVRRVVVTSSGATVGFASDPKKPLDETHHHEHAKAPYVRAKIEQEKLALADGRVEVVVLNPSGVFGPYDYKLTPATRGFIGLLQGDPCFFAVSITDVRDVARAHLLAAKKGRPGERYLITGDVLEPEETAAGFRELIGFGPSAMRPPRFLVGWIAWFQGRKARSSGLDAPITRELLDEIWGKHLAYDSTKSKRELGMTYRPAKEVVRDTIAWLLEQNALKPSVAKRIRAAWAQAA